MKQHQHVSCVTPAPHEARAAAHQLTELADDLDWELETEGRDPFGCATPAAREAKVRRLVQAMRAELGRIERAMLTAGALS